MKKFEFDKKGNLSVKETIISQVEIEGEMQEIEQQESREISAEQLAVHLPMLIVEMPPEILLQTQTIIQGLAGV